MADQRSWIKVWISAATDPALAIMPNEQFGQWVKFGLYLAQHGTHGSVTIKEPAKGVTHPLQNMLQLVSFNDVKLALQNFPNCDVTPRYDQPVTLQVTWRNWKRYQEETSWERMRRYRAKRVTLPVTGKIDKTRREVGSVSSSKKTKPTPRAAPSAREPDDFEQFWTLYPRHVAKQAALKAWTAALKHTLAGEIIAGLQIHLPYLRSCPQDKIPHASTWINGKRWHDDVQGSSEYVDTTVYGFLCKNCGAEHDETNGTRVCTFHDELGRSTIENAKIKPQDSAVPG